MGPSCNGCDTGDPVPSQRPAAPLQRAQCCRAGCEQGRMGGGLARQELPLPALCERLRVAQPQHNPWVLLGGLCPVRCRVTQEGALLGGCGGGPKGALCNSAAPWAVPQVLEEKPSGLLVASLQAKDPDEGENGTIIYSLIGTSCRTDEVMLPCHPAAPRSPHPRLPRPPSPLSLPAMFHLLSAGAWAERFTLHVATGELRTATVLRRSDRAEYIFTVTASDRGAVPRSASAIIRIQVPSALASLVPAPSAPCSPLRGHRTAFLPTFIAGHPLPCSAVDPALDTVWRTWEGWGRVCATEPVLAGKASGSSVLTASPVLSVLLWRRP